MRWAHPVMVGLTAIAASFVVPLAAQQPLPPAPIENPAQRAGPDEPAQNPQEEPAPGPVTTDTDLLDPDALFRQVFGKERPTLSAGRYSVIVDQINVGEYDIVPGNRDE